MDNVKNDILSCTVKKVEIKCFEAISYPAMDLAVPNIRDKMSFVFYSLNEVLRIALRECADEKDSHGQRGQQVG